MYRIDAHQHFWNYDHIEYGWMTDEMYAVKKDFLPQDLKPILEDHHIDGTVLVQVGQNLKETETLLKIAEDNDFVKGVVGWVDMRDNNIQAKLSDYKVYPKLKGFRHILQTEEPDFMLHPDFLNGIANLHDFDFTYDILIYPRHLEAAVALVEQFPEQRFVVDHLAKPNIRENELSEWEAGIRHLASYSNISCKISGLVTEADWKHWNPSDFTRYIDIVVNAFGTGRIMFGSDWPMCLVAASYGDVMNIVMNYFSCFTTHDQQLFFGENAKNFYKLQ
jgi:L-fuconolactonase